VDEGERGARGRVPPDHPPEACGICGSTADDPASVLTWTLETHEEHWSWLCPDCSRGLLHEIEARIDLDAIES
jgi:rubredoxin